MVAQTVRKTRSKTGSRLSFQLDPTVDATADVHEFSLVEGDVRVGADAMIAPGTAVTAEPGASVVVGEAARFLPGVIVEAAAGPPVTGPDGSAASIWVGEGSAIAHKSLIHSPAYIGKNCFIGFRSTIYNARLGDGCVVMMHVLVQDVEVPPGKCIPSGSVITSQHQADQLPNVRPEDLEFVQEVAGQLPTARKRKLASSSRSPKSSSNPSRSRIIPVRSAANRKPSYSTATEGANMQTQRLSPEIVQQVRQHLNQGYRIGMEHADKRRYRSGVWETCTPIKDTHEQAVFAGVERCLSEHQGEYVRMFGIDPQAKSRVGTMTIQRPGDKPKQSGEASSNRGAYGSGSQADQAGYPRSGSSGRQSGGYQSNSYRNGQSSQNGGGPITPGIAQEVRNLLSSGYTIGTEHAGPRHYRSNVWKVCSPIESKNEREVFSRLEHCLEEHSGEYVRMFGIDPNANRRTATTTIQRADGKPIEVSTHAVANARGYDQSSARYNPGSSDASDKVEQAVGQIIRNGNKIGVEHADKRRYRSGIWQTAPTIKANNKASASNQLQRFLDEHPDKYVRIFGIDTEMKTRGSSITIQKPGQRKQSSSDSQSGGSNGGQRQDPINENPPHYDDPSFLNRSGGRAGGYGNSGSNGSGNGLSSDVMDQVTRLVSQGHKISIEYADKRRYRSGIWKTGPAINARRPAEAISALGKQLAQHQGEYVRLVGTDANAKRRVAEMTIQRPGKSGGSSSQSRSSGGFSRGKDPINANPPHYDDPAFRGQPSSYNSGGYSASNAGSNVDANNGSLESEVLNQVTQLVNQGHKISLEYADKRRYRSGIWKTGEAIDARRPAEAISALGKQLAQHRGEYVRLVGTDTQAKRRVLESTIQRP